MSKVAVLVDLGLLSAAVSVVDRMQEGSQSCHGTSHRFLTNAAVQISQRASPGTGVHIETSRPKVEAEALAEYRVHMSTTLEQIVHDVMQLSPAQRAEFADLLAERLEATPPDEVQKLWVDEAKERLAEVRTGKVKAIPGEDVLAEARRLTKR